MQDPSKFAVAAAPVAAAASGGAPAAAAAKEEEKKEEPAEESDDDMGLVYLTKTCVSGVYFLMVLLYKCLFFGDLQNISSSWGKLLIWMSFYSFFISWMCLVGFIF